MRYLQDHGVTIWDEWADADGNLGPVYGYQWRTWQAPDGRAIDQIAQLVEASDAIPIRAAISSAPGIVADIDRMTLPPCHALFQFYVADGQAVLPAVPAQRRPVPRRAVQYRLLRPAHPDGGAGDCALQPGEFVHTLGDAHLYLNHLDQARDAACARAARVARLMRINPAVKDIFGFRYEDFTLRSL